MNEIDGKIVRILLEDANITNAKLSKKIGLSPSATLERVRHLERDNIIQGYTVTIDPVVVERGFEVMMTFILKVESQKDVDNFTEMMKNAKEVVTCAQVLGRYEFMAHLAVKDMSALQAFIDNKIRQISCIERMETLAVLNMIKRNAPLYPIEAF